MVRYHQFESHAYRRILLSVSSRAANYAPHRLTMLHGELSATSPPSLGGWLLTIYIHRVIYDVLLSTRCNVIPHEVRKLTLGHNSRLFHRIVLCASMINTQGVRCCSYLPFTLKGVALISGQVGHEPTRN